MKGLLLILLFLLAACNKGGNGAFEGLDNLGNGNPDVVDPVRITDFTPSQASIVLGQNSSMVFGITVSGGTGSLQYTFGFDPNSPLQTGASPFYVMNSSSLTQGEYTFKATASDGKSSASKEFTIRKNAPTQIVNFSPGSTGAVVNCGAGALTFSGVMMDPEGDPYTMSWELDNQPVTVSTPFTSMTSIAPYSQLIYTPDCTKVGAHTLTLKVNDGYDITTKTWNFNVNVPPAVPGSVSILSFTPTTDPIILTASSSATFAVAVNSDAGQVDYEFLLDNTTSMQAGATNYLSLTGANLTAGYHSLKVRASNGTSVAEKNFNIRKNTAPVIISSAPALLGQSANCSSGSITFNAIFTDGDSDNLTKTWELDGMPVSSSTPFVTTSTSTFNTQLVYSPDCTKTGSHSLSLTISDGYESTSKTWTFAINNPPPVPGAVAIQTFTPVLDPVILTAQSNSTFAVTVNNDAGTVNYDFIMDNSTTVQSGASNFYSLAGSTVSSGYHSLKVRASNGTTTAEKTFNIRKNTAPAILSFTPALLGQSVNCGSASIAFSTVFTDSDSDLLAKTWELDGARVTASTSFTTISETSNTSQLIYSPDCSKSGSHSLSLTISDGYESTTKTWTFAVINPPTPPGAVAFQTFTPTVDPIVLTSSTSATFAVTVNSDAGAVNYEFTQDNSSSLQSGSSNYYALSGSSLTPGYHSLKIRATNANSSAEKVFNIRKNTAPSVLSFSPALLGQSTNCGSGSLTFAATFSDGDGETLTKTWQLDGNIVTNGTSFTNVSGTANTAQLIYSPDCTAAGSHTLSLTVSDGYETATKTWTFSVNNPPAPPGNVQILSFTPANDPIVMTNSSETTFAVSIRDGAGTVQYEFKKDYTTVLQTSETPFYVLSGSSLSAGAHTLKVKGTNAVSSDEKIFNIRKNTPTNIISYSPALTGSSMNCGQDTLRFNAVMTDIDSDAYTVGWEIDAAPVTSTTPYASVISGASNSQLSYNPDCTRSGSHTITIKVNDGYETTSLSWSITVNNPAVETLTSFFPTSSNVVYLSTDTSKSFNVSGTGVGALTFKWKLDGTLIKTDANVTSSNLAVLASSLTYGTHTLEVALTDSITSNDPVLPVKQQWVLYKNMKPRFVSYSPTSAKAMNLNNTQVISASIEDQQDTFYVTFMKGSTTCAANGAGVASTCGISGYSAPTTTGNFTATFSPGTTFLGENNFTLKVTDSYGEYITQDFTITANYFSNYCNGLSAGQICTLVGLPGLGSGLSTITEANKIRVTPAWMTQDDQGNFFFSDHATHVVWYYNAKSVAVTVLGVSVPANSIAVVAGTGIAGTGGNGVNARSFALSFGGWGGGLAWDTRDQALFIADYANSRVVRVNNTGRANVICSGSSTTQGALASLSDCGNPVDVEIDNTNRRLFVTLQSRYVIRSIDISSTDTSVWTSYIIAGLWNTNGPTNGTTNMVNWSSTTSGTSRLSQPWGLYLDTADQILYFTEYGSCKVRALGLPSSTTRSVAGQSITANNVVILTNGATCGSEAINTDVSVGATRFNRPQDVLLEKSGSTINGFYVTDFYGHRVSFCNNAAVSLTIGNQTIAPQMCNNVLGNGNGSASTIPPSGKNTSINSPLGLYKDATTMYVGDRGYNQLRMMPVNVVSGTVATYIGGVGRASYSGNSPLDSKLVTFNSPLNLMYKDSGKYLYVSDASNQIIRSISLADGRVEDFIGGLSGTETRLQTTATSTYMSSPRAMTMYNDFFLYADSNNNCFVRGYNPRATNELMFGTLVNSNRTTPLAGYPNNCGAYVGTSLAVTDTNAKLNNPYGIGVDTSTNTMYVASKDNHCIMKVTDDGMIRPFIGTCGTMATAPVYGDLYSSSNMKLRYPMEIFMDPQYPGNFFFTDFTDQSTAHVKYVNLTRTSVTINGTTVALNNVETVYASVSSPGFIRSVTAFDKMICFTSGTTSTGQGNNTITCYNRDDADTTTYYRFGVAGAGSIQLKEEQEGTSAVSATFAAPGGLAFDSSGNLYVTEQGSHVIRMIKRWW